MKKIFVLLTALFILTACSGSKGTETKVIKVASHKQPMTDIIEIAKEELAKEGYTIEFIPVSDNVAPNIALNNKEIDANFFQHRPFMKQFNEKNNGTLVGIQPIYDAIVGFYSKNYTSLADLPDTATIAIPNDYVNQSRALRLLAQENLVTIKEGTDLTRVSVKDLESTNYTFKEVDLLSLTPAYEETDLVFNYPAYIKALNLQPKDALFVEKGDHEEFAITLVAREDNKDSEEIQALKKVMTSQAVKDFLLNEENSQTLLPSF